MQSVFARVLLIISLSTAFFTSLYLYPPYATPDPLGDRVELHHSISLLDTNADVLAQELLMLDLKIKKAQQTRDLIQKDLASTSEKRDEALKQHNEALGNKKNSLKKIGPWLNFQYRNGYWKMVDSILDSSSLSELINRTMLISFILERQMKDYRTAQEDCASYLQKEQALNEAADQLNIQSTLLEDQIKELKVISDRRKTYFADIKNTSLDLAKKVTSLEMRFLASLDLYSFLTGAIAKFSWSGLEPDRISFNADGIHLEISEASLNKSLHTSGSEDLKIMSVDLRPGIFALSGKDKKIPSSFALGGVLEPSGQFSSVKFYLRELSLDGIPVTREVIDMLTDNWGFQIPIPEAMRLFKISRIDISDDKFTMVLNK